VELSGYIAVVRRWWWTLLVAAWVAGLTGFLVASQIAPTYESRVSLLVGPINTDQNTLRASGQLVQTYAQLVTTAPLLDSAIQETGLPITTAELVPLIRATANDVTRILSIRVQSGDPENAATIANAIATELIQLASRGIGRPEGQVQIIEPAAVIPIPVAPQVSILVLLAAGAGLIGALVIVLLIEYLSDSVRSREDLVRTSGATSLGVVGTGGSDLIAMPSGRAGQSYLLLAAKLILAREARDTASILVLDATTTRTASLVAANLAAAIGRLGRRAIVIDGAPGQQGGLTRLFELEGRIGVSDFLVNSTTRDLSAMARGINIVPSGTIDLPAIDVDRCRALVASVSKSYDVVLVATAPVTESAIATVWARACDGAMLIAERDHSRRTDVALATESLALVERPLIGVVLAERGRSLRGRARAADNEPTGPAAVRVRAPARAWDDSLAARGPSRPNAPDDSASTARTSRPDLDESTIASLRPTAARPPDAFRAAAPPATPAPGTPASAAPFSLTPARSIASAGGLRPAPSPQATPPMARPLTSLTSAPSTTAAPTTAAPTNWPRPTDPVGLASPPRPLVSPPASPAVPTEAARTTPMSPPTRVPAPSEGPAAADRPTLATTRAPRSTSPSPSATSSTPAKATRTATPRASTTRSKPATASVGPAKGSATTKASATSKATGSKASGSAKAATTKSGAPKSSAPKSGTKKSAASSRRRAGPASGATDQLSD